MYLPTTDEEVKDFREQLVSVFSFQAVVYWRMDPDFPLSLHPASIQR